MENLRDVRNRMKSVKQTLQVTNAMKLISTSKLRKARKRLENAQPYFDEIEEAISDIVNHVEDLSVKWFDLRSKKKDRKVASLLITSDKGLAGPYNANVIHFAEKNISKDSIIYPMGNYGKRWFVDKGFKVDDSFLPHTREPAIWVSRDIANEIADKFFAEDVDEFHIFYTHMYSVVRLVPQKIDVLPLSIKKFKSEKEVKDNLVYNWMPDEGHVFDFLVPRYIKGVIFGALIEAFTSEQAARMTAMDSASKNAQDMLDSLMLSYNRARQAAITKEVSEIVSGAAAQEE